MELDAGVPEASTPGHFHARLGDRLADILDEIVLMLEEAQVIFAEGRVAIVDATCSSPCTRVLIARIGMTDAVQTRGATRKVLTAADRARKVEIGVARGRVEAIIGHWKRHWGFRRTRLLGREKMAIMTSLTAIGWNIWKGAGFKARHDQPNTRL